MIEEIQSVTKKYSYKFQDNITDYKKSPIAQKNDSFLLPIHEEVCETSNTIKSQTEIGKQISQKENNSGSLNGEDSVMNKNTHLIHEVREKANKLSFDSYERDDDHSQIIDEFEMLNELRKLRFDESPVSDSCANDLTTKKNTNPFTLGEETIPSMNITCKVDHQINKKFDSIKNKNIFIENCNNTSDSKNNFSSFTSFLENNPMLKYFDNSKKNEDTPKIELSKLTKPLLFIQKSDKELTFRNKEENNLTQDFTENENETISFLNFKDQKTNSTSVLTAYQNEIDPYNNFKSKQNYTNDLFDVKINRNKGNLNRKIKSNSLKHSKDQQINLNKFDSCPNFYYLSNSPRDECYEDYHDTSKHDSHLGENISSPRYNNFSNYNTHQRPDKYMYYDNNYNSYTQNSNKNVFENIIKLNLNNLRSNSKHFTININNNTSQIYNNYSNNFNINNFIPSININSYVYNKLQHFNNPIYSNDYNNCFSLNYGNINSEHVRNNHNEMVEIGRRELNSIKHQKNNIFNYMNMSNEELCQHSYNIAKDQSGCRYLQKKIDEYPEIVSLVYQEIIGYIVELMNDSFGNYLVQKILDYVSEEQIYQILAIIKPHVSSLGMNPHGTRVLQKIVDLMITDELITSFIKLLKPNVINLIKDINGNHIIQKFLYLKDNRYSNFIYEIINENITEISTHKHGCCVIQKCIDNAKPHLKKALIDTIISCSASLIIDQYGNYVIQYVLLMNNFDYSKRLIEGLMENIYFLAKQKYSSNVVEKFFDYCDDFTKNNLISSLLKPEIISDLLFDIYGNYVLQKVLSLTNEEDRLYILSHIAPLMEKLKFHYGSKLYSKLILTYPQLCSLMLTIEFRKEDSDGNNTQFNLNSNYITLNNKLNNIQKQNSMRLVNNQTIYELNFINNESNNNGKYIYTGNSNRNDPVYMKRYNNTIKNKK